MYILTRILTLFAVLLSGLLSGDASAQCLNGGTFNPQTQFYKTTGVYELDAKFNETGNTINALFGVAPNLLMFVDGQNPNAYASGTATNPYFPDGTLYFGISLLRSELWGMGNGEVAIAGIMAHEFAHIYQVKKNCNLQGKFRELQADYLAGFYLAKQSYLNANSISGFAQSLAQKGDFDFRNPLHHGTPKERVDAMIGGYQDSSGSIEEAYDNSITFLTGSKTTTAQADSSASGPTNVTPAEDAIGSAEDEPFRYFVAQTKDGVAKFKGKHVPGVAGMWDATIEFPGASNTDIQRDEGEYSLNATFVREDDADAKETFDDLIALAKKDLGESWKFEVKKGTSTLSSSYGNTQWRARISKISSKVVIDIHYNEYNRGKHRVMVSFTPRK